jgi:hypothetical protein
MLSIKGIEKHKVLMALYNNSKPLGMGMMHYTPEDMTESEAKEILTKRFSFDYLKGRVMKVDLSEDEFDPWLYDRDNGEGAAEKALSGLLSNQVKPQ